MKIGLIVEYEDIMLGNRRDFSSAYVNRQTLQRDCIDLLKYVFEDLLHWTPSMIMDFTTKELLDQLHLTRIIRRLEFPPEIDPEKDLFYLPVLMYPDKLGVSKRDLVLRVYQKLLAGKLSKYPKNFFLNKDGDINACICLQYAINTDLQLESIEDLYAYFSDKSKCSKFLHEHKLYNACREIYEYPIDFLHDSLPTEQQEELLYRYYRFKTVFEDTKKARREKACG
uniref:hypothetical protein n=1 Tax=Lachnoclostridium phocaeense TaxID=1871021 RepID=UPI0026DC5DEC|nr:hypothetical protein [Lachnoclostridium phocaeense]